MSEILSPEEKAAISEYLKIIQENGWQAGESFIEEQAELNPLFHRWATIVGVMGRAEEILIEGDKHKGFPAGWEIAMVECFEILRKEDYEKADEYINSKSQYLGDVAVFFSVLFARELI